MDAHAASAALIHGAATAGKRTGLAKAGDETTWSARFFGVGFRLTTRIEDYNRPVRFSDVMCKGLFRHFKHAYTFDALAPGQTRLVDEFSFESPFTPIGTALDRIVLCPRMRTVARARVQFLKQVAEGEEWRRYLADERDDKNNAGPSRTVPS